MLDYLYIDDLQVSTRRVRGLGSPSPRRDVFLRASQHGARDLTRFYDGRLIDLEGLIAAGSAEDSWAAFDALKAKLQLGDTRTLRFRRSGITEDEQLEVIVASVVDAGIDYDMPAAIPWGVGLFAEDPRIYGAVLRVASYDPAAALSGGGVSFPLALPLEFSVTTTSLLEVLNTGNMKTPPVLTLEGPAETPIFDNETTGESITTNISLGASDTLVIDVTQRTVELNGSSRLDLIDIAETAWWELDPGTNRLRVRGAGMSVGSTLFTVQYRNARI